ncbi:hypothetical protein [Dyella jiangningensis]
MERQPAAELIKGTLAMWGRVITNGRAFDEQRDTPRFRAAFLTLGARRTWPAPQDFIDALPRIEKERTPLRLMSDEQRERNRRRINGLIDKLNFGGGNDTAA